jgi:hypothetical protein
MQILLALSHRSKHKCQESSGTLIIAILCLAGVNYFFRPAVLIVAGHYAIQSGNCQNRWQSMAKHQYLEA